jgi:hypothetical protein
MDFVIVMPAGLTSSSCSTISQATSESAVTWEEK